MRCDSFYTQEKVGDYESTEFSHQALRGVDHFVVESFGRYLVERNDGVPAL